MFFMAQKGSRHLRPIDMNNINAAQAVALQKMDGVLGIFPETIYELHTTRSPEFLGLDAVTAMQPDGPNYGEDVVVRVLDTGIWPESESFNGMGLGPVSLHWKGECETSTKFKASVGSEVIGASLLGYANGTARGMAPKARIAAYKVCWVGGCFSTDILKAIDKVVADGVNVLSMSLDGGIAPYYRDSISLGAFGAMQRGIFVSCSAGNSGPDAVTLSNVVPWIATVGASTMAQQLHDARR